jgi:hypothetical protein
VVGLHRAQRAHAVASRVGAGELIEFSDSLDGGKLELPFAYILFFFLPI